MTHIVSDIAFTPAVKAQQALRGSRVGYALLEQKRDWQRAFRAIRVLIRDSERTDQVFEILDALEGPTNERGYREFVSHPEGRQLLDERPDLLATLSDHDSLASLPEGSFGRAYLAFMQEAGLSAQGLVDAELDREGIEIASTNQLGRVDESFLEAIRKSLQ